MRVAIVHDWIDTYRGGEKVLEVIAEMYPSAPIFTLFYDSRLIPESLNKRDIRVIRGLNRFRRLRKWLLPLLPSMIESINIDEFDLVISSSSCVAKGVIPSPSAVHVCYIHSPMRYIWDQRGEYFQGMLKIPLLSSIIHLILSQLRTWDTASSCRVDRFIANSYFVKQRVGKFYGRSAHVVHPPVALEHFRAEPPRKNKSSLASDFDDLNSPFFLIAGSFVGYKRVDLGIEACRLAGKKLVIAGSGPDEAKLRKLASNTLDRPNHSTNHSTKFDKPQETAFAKTGGGIFPPPTPTTGRHQSQTYEVSFEISPSAERWSQLLSKCEALIYPGIEDFGIVPIEALASGTPVIAMGKGGALDYVTPGINGELFQPQCPNQLAKILRTFEPNRYDKTKIVDSSAKFSKQAFIESMRQQIQEALSEKMNALSSASSEHS